MKKMMLSFVVLMALFVSSCATSCPQSTNQQILSALADNDDVMTLSVGSFGLFFVKMLGGFEELPALNGIKSVEILSIRDRCPNNRREKIKQQITRLSDDDEYATLLQVKDKEDQVRMLVRQENEVVKELLLAVVSDDDSAVIRVKGKLNLSDVQTMIEKSEKQKTKKN